MRNELLLSAMLPICGMAGEAYGMPPGDAVPAPKEQPNIILFLVDDMGWQDTSLPFWTQRTKYNDTYHTPNMERMATQGKMFTQAYACSISSPTRVSLFTGMNAARHRVTSWTLRKNTTHEQPDSVMIYPEWNVNGICQEPGVERTTQVTSLAEVLKDHGYHTIHCGKAHFGAEGTPGADPLKMGFEDECVWGKNNSAELILTSSEQYKTYCELKKSGPVDLVVGEFYKDSKTNVLYMYLGEYTKLIFNKNTCAFRNNEDDLLIVSKLESKQKLKMFVKVFEFYKHSKRYDFVSVSKSVSDRFVKTPESFVFDDSLLNEPVLTTKILRKKLIKDEFKYLYLASSSYGSVFLFKNANDIKTYDFKNDAILNEVNSYIRYTKSEIDFSKINDKNYVDSIIDVYSFDKKPRENANIHSVVFL
jgi:hypothetical protein